MSGQLIVVGTPIGNLCDMSPRAIEVLKQADLIAAEDTRHTIKLLNHFQITTPMTSYHEHNAVEKGKHLVERMKSGQVVALVSDAGMPAISDPGELLVRACHENRIFVTCVPGPTAAMTALAISGLSTRKFVFEGFLPQGKKERSEILNALKDEQKTLIFYESPHHLKKTVALMNEVFGNREVTLCRELTKKFEQIQRFSFDECVEYFTENEPKGEYVIVVSGQTDEEILKQKQLSFENLTVLEHVNKFINELQLSEKDAMKAVAKERGVSKSVIYNQIKN